MEPATLPFYAESTGGVKGAPQTVLHTLRDFLVLQLNLVRDSDAFLDPGVIQFSICAG
jgi:hypothetical protein